MRWLVAAVAVVGSTLSLSEPAAVHVERGNQRQRTVAQEAAWAFEQAGLPLPSVRIRFLRHDDCGGYEGLHRPGGEITICAPEPGSERRILIHELAHAWLDANLTGDRRNAFLLLRGLTSWDDRRHDWRHRGSEQAAEIITWGLVRPPLLMVRIPDKSCVELAHAYRVLTRRDPVLDRSICPVH